MATLISKATGDFTAAGTWAPIATEAGCELDSEAGNTDIFNGTRTSSAFTPGANELDGAAIKVRQKIAGASGTVTVKLANQTSPGTREASVTVNWSDFHNGLLNTLVVEARPGAWYFFKFGSPVTPNGTDSYTLQVTGTFSNQLNIYCDSTANNMSRMLRRTSAASAPASGDKLVVVGEMTGAGTSNSFTVTMNETATTSYGPTVSGGPPQGMVVGDKATMSYGVAASTNYYLKVKGILAVTAGGTFNIGTSGSQMPSTSTAVLEFDTVAATPDSGLNIGNGATCNVWGATKTNVLQYLTADKAAAATTLAVGDTTGWAVSDELGIASTTRTVTDCEKKTILTVDSGTGVTLTAGLSAAHSGTSPTQAEVINLTRNVKVRGVSTSLQGYVYAQNAATVVLRYAEFSALGVNNDARRGVETTTTTGSFDMQYCSVHDTALTGGSINIRGAAANNFTISNNVIYNVQEAGVWLQVATSGTNWTISNNTVIRVQNGIQQGFSISDVGGTFTGNIAVGSSGTGIAISESADGGTFADLTGHSNGGVGILFSGNGPNNCTVSNLTAWRNNIAANSGGGISFGTANANMAGIVNTVFDGITSFGTLNNMAIYCTMVGCTINNYTASGDTTFSSETAVSLVNAGQGFHEVLFTNGDWGTVTGIKTAHTVADFRVTFAGSRARIVFHNTKFASATEVVNNGFLSVSSYLRSQRHDQTAGLHKAWYPSGTAAIDTSTYRTASPSELLTPSSASVKLESGPKRIGVPSAGTATITVHVKKSGAYNGNAPRLRERKNVAAGIAADSTIASLTGGADGDGWWTLSGTTSMATDDAALEYYVDCDGTAGTLSVDDWVVA